jgi:hypothetical protein
MTTDTLEELIGFVLFLVLIASVAMFSMRGMT